MHTAQEQEGVLSCPQSMPISPDFGEKSASDGFDPSERLRYRAFPMSSNEQLFERFGKEAPAGTVLFREDDPGDTMYIVQSGRVRISREAEGHNKVLAELGPGEFLGEMAILNGKPRTATAEVIEPAKLLVLDAKKFEAMVTGNTEIAVRLIKKLSRRLDNADALIEILMHRDPKARVILGLARYADATGVTRPDGSVLVKMTREQLAEQIGLSPDQTHGSVQRLARLGIIEESSEGFAIKDVARLNEFLDFLSAREKSGEI